MRYLRKRLRQKYQVLDGHHRIEILRELGHTEARCDAWDVDDREAKLLLATLKPPSGAGYLPIRWAQLIHELLGEMNIEDLGGLLPETEKQLEELHALGEPLDNRPGSIEPRLRKVMGHKNGLDSAASSLLGYFMISERNAKLR